MQNEIKELNLTNLRWIIYCRKSSDSEDKQIESLPAQRKELHELAEREGFKKIVQIYEESDSAFHPGRPYFNEMMAKFDKGEADGLLVWAGNRISRNMKDGGEFIYKIDQGKIKAVKTKGGLYLNTPEDKFALSIDFSVSKKSSDDLSVAVLRGNRRKFHDKNDWAGLAKQGYLNYTHPLTKENTIISDPDRFGSIRNALLLMVEQGYTPMKALHTLNDEWHFTTKQRLKTGGSSLPRTTWYKIIKDPFYFGLMVRKVDGVIQEKMGDHEPMITKDQFMQLQIRLGEKGNPHYKKREIPFKDLLVCGGCGANVTATQQFHVVCTVCKKKFVKSKTNCCSSCKTPIDKMANPKIYEFVNYECIGKKKGNGCSEGSLSLAELKKRTHSELLKYEIPEEFKDWSIEYLNELNNEEEKRDSEIKAQLSNKLAIIEQQLRNSVKLRISPSFQELPEDQKQLYEEEEKNLIEQRKNLRSRSVQADQDQEKWIRLAKDTFDFVCYARYWFEKGEIEDKAYVLSRLGSNLAIEKRKLRMVQHKPYYFIEKGKAEALEVAKQVLTKEKIELTGNLLDLEPVCNVWRRWRDSNPRDRCQSTLSRRLP